jgi:hypothetical protein
MNIILENYNLHLYFTSQQFIVICQTFCFLLLPPPGGPAGFTPGFQYRCICICMYVRVCLSHITRKIANVLIRKFVRLIAIVQVQGQIE